MMAVGACAAITLGLTIFAFQTKIDFTAMGGVLLAVLICFIIFGFIAAFFPASRTLNLVYASIGCIIFRLDMFPFKIFLEEFYLKYFCLYFPFAACTSCTIPS